MKILNLNNYGVLEMNAAEMLEIEGGFWKEAWQGIKDFGKGLIDSFFL
jgi:hypothetical protein